MRLITNKELLIVAGGDYGDGIDDLVDFGTGDYSSDGYGSHKTPPGPKPLPKGPSGGEKMPGEPNPIDLTPQTPKPCTEELDINKILINKK